jgi:hypothetical protein
MNPQKVGGLIILFVGIPFGLFASDRILTASYVSLGLMLVFFAKERINDERVQQLKMKAMFTAMSMAFGAILVTHADYLDFLLLANSGRRPSVMSAPEFLAGMLLVASGLYYYWRWQDGRGDRTE